MNNKINHQNNSNQVMSPGTQNNHQGSKNQPLTQSSTQQRDSAVVGKRMMARDYDKFSPIRQIGAQIGTDYNSVPPMSSAGLGIIGLNGNKGAINGITTSAEDKTGAFISHDLDIDSAENLSSSHINHQTLSPQRLQSIREEVGTVGNLGGRMRILESQPGGQTIGEPLWSANLDSQKRPRGGFCRPFTNSPFPYMQKRSAKTKFQQQQISQGPLPSTAATSSNNHHLSIINELAPGTAGAVFQNLGSAGGLGQIQGIIGSVYNGSRVNGVGSSSYAQQLLKGEEGNSFQYNLNNITSLQQNLKQNMADAASVIINNGGMPSSQNQSLRNGAFNFGLNLGSEGSGLMGGPFDRERVLSGGGPSDDSSFYQFNDKSAFIDNEDTMQRFSSIGGKQVAAVQNSSNAEPNIERRNSQQHHNVIPRAKATIDVNSKTGNNNSNHTNNNTAQTVHLRKIINKDSSANSPTKDAQKLTAAGTNTSNYYVINSNKGKKRKLLTEPQSPSDLSSYNTSNQHFAFTHQNLDSQLHSLNPSHNNSRELPIRISGNRVGQGKGGSVGPTQTSTNSSHYNSVQVSSNAKIKGHIKKNSIDVISSGGPRLNHHFTNQEDNNSNHHYHSVQKYNVGGGGGVGVSSYHPSAERNNSSFENHATTQDERGRLLSEERQSTFLPRLDAHQRQTNSQVMYRDLDENNKSQLRERVDMSMRSPTNNWIHDSISKMPPPNKKSISTERKNTLQIGQSSTISHTNNNSSSSDINKIFKPQIKNANNKGTRHQKQATSSVAQGLSPAGALTGLNGIHVLTHQHSMSGSSNNLGISGIGSGIPLSDSNQFFKELNRPSDHTGPLKGIGKIQPFNNEFKLNEQLIRGKLQANSSQTSNNNNRNMQVQIKNLNGVAFQDSMNSSSKPSVGSSNLDQKLMINVTRGSNLQLIPLTEISSPNNLSSPMNSGGSIANSAMQMLIHQNSVNNQANFNQSSAQQNRLKLQSQEQNLIGNSQFLSSFERPDTINPQNLYRAAGAISSLSQDFQNITAVQSPVGANSVSNQQMHSNYLQNHNLQQMSQNENIRPFNYRNFSVSQASSKESANGMNPGMLNNTPQKSMGEGAGTTSQDYSITPNSHFIYDEDLNSRGEVTGLRTQHSSGQVNLQNNLLESAGAGRQLFSPPQQQLYHNYASQNSGARVPLPYFEQSNQNINFIDNCDQLTNGITMIPNLNTQNVNHDPHTLNSAGGMLSLRSQNSQQYQVNHQIKTVASKQIPKCFRMSKQQLQQITNKVASRGSVYNGGIIPFGPPSGLAKSPNIEGSVGNGSNQQTPQDVLSQNQQQFQQSPSHFNQKALGIAVNSNVADNRVSFNDYSQFQTMQKQLNQAGMINNLTIQNLAAINHNSSPIQGQNNLKPNLGNMPIGARQGEVSHNNIFSSGGKRRRSSDHEQDKQSLMDRDISERSVDEERERMTPAFNNRIKIDSMRNTQNASAAGLNGKNGPQDPAANANVNTFKQVTLNIPNESHINAMNHTLNSKGINLTEAITSAKID